MCALELVNAKIYGTFVNEYNFTGYCSRAEEQKRNLCKRRKITSLINVICWWVCNIKSHCGIDYTKNRTFEQFK